jgi:hypothetical protein
MFSDTPSTGYLQKDISSDFLLGENAYEEEGHRVPSFAS